MSRTPSLKLGFRAAMLLAVLAGMLFAAPAMAQRPVTLAEYDQALASVETQARQAGAGDAAAEQAAIDAITPLLRCTVRTPDRNLVFADNRPILAQMQGARLETVAAARRKNWSEIALEIASIRAAPPKRDPSQDRTAVASATSVLSTAEFASDPLPGISAWDRFWDRVGDWIAKELEKLFPRSHIVPDSISPIVPEIIVIVLLVFVVGLIVTLLVQAWRRYVAAKGDASLVGESSLAMTFEERELVATHNFNRLRELAQQASARGDYRSAFRLIFLAMLVYLDAEGAIKLDRSKTNWEYLRLLGGFSDLRERLTPLVRDFDRIWYGEQTATEEDFQRADAQFDEIRQSISSWMPAASDSAAAQKSSPTAVRTI